MPTISSPFSRSRPTVSSPLAESFDTDELLPRPIPKPQPARKTCGFMTSRALRPFPTIAHALQPSKSTNIAPSKTIKLIQPPENHKMTFLLDLTQAEFSRQE